MVYSKLNHIYSSNKNRGKQPSLRGVLPLPFLAELLTRSKRKEGCNMVEERPRVQKVLAELYDAEEPVRPREIAEKIGETSLNVGKDLHRLKERGLAGPAGEGQWCITPEGREWIEGGAEGEKGEREGEKGKGKGRETTETVPSQSDLFRSIGEKLGVGSRKGDIRLDAITYYVQRTADLDNLTSVWNALTEMGVANDVKKRWIKIYAQNLPGKEIPEELKEKLEGGLEPEKVKVEGGEISPKPKRFSVVGSEIIGDAEGDYSFKEALQYVAQQKGVPSAQADPLAAMVEAMKLGPEMATATLTTMIPLITKEPPNADNTLSQALQALKDVGAFGKQEGDEGTLLSQLDSLGLLRKTGEEGRSTQIEMLDKLNQLGLLKKPGEEGSATQTDMLDKLNQLGLLKKPGEEAEGSQTLVALQDDIKELRESLQKQEMDTVKNAVVSLSNQLGEMRKDMANQGKLEGRYALLDKTIGAIENQLTGIRSDARPVLDSLAHRGGGQGSSMRSPEERAKIAKGLKQAVLLEEEARKLEDELLFSVKAS